MNRPLIITFVGVPGSGKTTFARQLAKELKAVILNSDSIRLIMWKTLDAIRATHADPDDRKHANQLTFGAMNYAAKQILAAGYSVVYDCNANHLWERQEKHDIAHETNALSIIVRISVPYDLSLKRIQEREVSHDSRRISPEKAVEILDRFASEIEEPGENEHVIKIDGAQSFDQQLRSFYEQFPQEP